MTLRGTASPTTLRTVSLREIDLLAPDPAMIDIADIAYGLAGEPRFAGQTKPRYFVGQHSLYVSSLCRQHPLEGLLHDGAEYLLRDVSTPLKRLLGHAYAEVETRLEIAIADKFELTYCRAVSGRDGHRWPEEVRQADRFALAMEQCVLRGVGERPNLADYPALQPQDVEEIRPLSSGIVEILFLQRFEELLRDRRSRQPGLR